MSSKVLSPDLILELHERVSISSSNGMKLGTVSQVQELACANASLEVALECSESLRSPLCLV